MTRKRLRELLYKSIDLIETNAVEQYGVDGLMDSEFAEELGITQAEYDEIATWNIKLLSN